MSYTIERDRLLAFADLAELGVSPASDLPRRVILLPRPHDDELNDTKHLDHLVERYLRLLFHACVHLDLENRADHLSEAEREAWGEQRRSQIGEVEFAEIRAVLLKDDTLFPPTHEVEIYTEFAATYLELRYFVPHERRWYFPALRDWGAADWIIGQDVDHVSLFQRFRAVHVAEHATGSPADAPAGGEKLAAAARGGQVTLARFRQLQAKAERTAAMGNGLKALLLHLRAAHRAPPGYEGEALAAAQAELRRFGQRLQNSLRLSADETEQWCAALESLLSLPAAAGFRSENARLLYDLQKVCVVQERGIYRLDLVEWIRTLGKRPIRRPLPLMQDALMLRHFRAVRRRLSLVTITAGERARLSDLLDDVQPRLESRARDRLRGIIVHVLDEVGLVPQNVPEDVARRKLVEELLDRIVERGYFNMADLRDSLSKNDLKLPDVTTIAELVFGDRLLRADHRFDAALDGVYRRGAVYQRWPQTLSSLVFGTNLGRFLTQHLFVPFGGAFLIVEFLHHLRASFVKEVPAAEPQPPADSFIETFPDSIDWGYAASILTLGIWLSLLLHRPAVRATTVALLMSCWRLLKTVLVDIPSVVLHSRYVQWILSSKAFAVIRGYFLEPAICVLVIWLALGARWTWRVNLDLFLGTALFLNSPIGRYVSELTADLMMRAWHELKIRVFAAIVQWIVDLFDGLRTALERMVYTVDEWLRFRAGDNRLVQAIKLAGGVVWFFVSYVVIFVFTLLVEPQINPIKHFPVVTVSHKLILPTWPMLVNQLTPYLGRAQANTLVGTTIWLIPGVFGFLVWELKENWRLYAANRPRRLNSEPIGHHSETMMRLLRPGTHSGTLPKAFASLRRAARKVHDVDEHHVNRKRTTILHTEEAVRHFVERELINLLDEVRFLPETNLTVGAVNSATNRVEVELLRADRIDQAAVLSWEYHGGKLVGAVRELGWVDQLAERDRQIFMTALMGLFQRSGVEQARAALPPSATRTILWHDWVALWPRQREETTAATLQPERYSYEST
jgi:hypothetical protein